MHVNDAIATK